MKHWDKSYIGAFLLLDILFVGFIGFDIFKTHQMYTEKIEPDMKRYATMTQQEQDQYFMSKLGVIYSLFYRMDDSAEEVGAVLDAMQNDPAVRQASLTWGRALCATIINDSKDISATLSAADREKFEKEADDLDDKGERFRKELKRIVPPKK